MKRFTLFFLFSFVVLMVSAVLDGFVWLVNGFVVPSWVLSVFWFGFGLLCLGLGYLYNEGRLQI